LSAKNTVTLTTNRQGEITLFAVDQFNDSPDGENVFRISMHTPSGVLNFNLSSKHGFYIDGATGFRVNGSVLMELIAERFSVQGDTVDIRGRDTVVTGSEQVLIGSDENVVVSAAKKLLLFGRDFLVKIIQTIAIEAAIIGIKARASLELSANTITMEGRMIHGKTPRPVARVGDVVQVQTASGPAVGTIQTGSSQFLVS